MYKCHKCQNPLTEVDVKFNQQAFPNKNISDYECAPCVLGENNYSNILEKNKKRRFADIWWYVLPLVPFIIIVVQSIPSILNPNNHLDSSEELMMCYVFSIIISIIVQCVKNPVKDKEGWVSGYHYEGTIDSSGNLITRKVDEYSHSDEVNNRLGFIVGGIFLGPVWYPIYCVVKLLIYYFKPIHAGIKLSLNCPKHVIKSFEAAYHSRKFYKIPKHQRNSFNAKVKSYNNKINRVIKYYSVMGAEEVNRQISLLNLKPPIFYATIHGVKYIVVKETTDMLYLVEKNNPKVSLTCFKGRKIYE